jgi:hypothetical protein
MTSRDEAGHETSIAAWDLTSPVIVGRPATLKVGVACPSGCNLSGTSVDVHNETGARVGGGTLGPTPWPATAALYWTELVIDPLDADGDRAWSIRATTAEPAHADATSIVRFVACGPPEHRVTLDVIDKTSGAPLAGVELRLGGFRTATNDVGIACVEVPRGTYEVGTWKSGYEMASQTVVIAADIDIHLEMTALGEPEQPYWM